MRIIRGDNFITIECDCNVLKYSTGRYIDADMRQYNISEPSLNELRRIYNEAQRVYFKLQGKGVDAKECVKARTELANVYKRYKEALIE